MARGLPHNMWHIIGGAGFPRTWPRRPDYLHADRDMDLFNLRDEMLALVKSRKGRKPRASTPCSGWGLWIGLDWKCCI